VTGDGQLRCVFCGRVIASPAHGWRKVVGWERERSQGGTNALAVRQPLDEWCCVEDMQKLRRGLDPAQQSLLNPNP
jgi:hypothetical protein